LVVSPRIAVSLRRRRRRRVSTPATKREKCHALERRNDRHSADLSKKFAPCEIVLQRTVSSVPVRTKPFPSEKPSRFLQPARRGRSDFYPFAEALDSFRHSPLYPTERGKP
jgi:hypothetical protein